MQSLIQKRHVLEPYYDMAVDNEEQAVSLFEYYLLTKESGVENCEAAEEIIQSVDENHDKIAHLFQATNDFEARINAGEWD